MIHLAQGHDRHLALGRQVVLLEDDGWELPGGQGKVSKQVMVGSMEGWLKEGCGECSVVLPCMVTATVEVFELAMAVLAGTAAQSL